MVAIPDGFLVPFKTDGSISLVDLDGQGPYKLTDDQTGKWFYHRVVWKDMVTYKKGALDSQPQVIKFTSCLPMVGGSLRVLRLLPPLKLVAMI
jgi:hypothetical protein